jgi:HAE1 family hydrophobic/amphiphilic exporter-1
MQWLAALCVRRPVFAWVLVLSLTVVGLFALGRLGVDRFPNIDIPTVVVTTRLPGAAPEQIETEVTDKIEEAVNTISAIDTLNSTSSEGISQVVVSFRRRQRRGVVTAGFGNALQACGAGQFWAIRPPLCVKGVFECAATPGRASSAPW